VVLYHTSYCGLCGAASLAFLNVARLFRHTPHLEFARIDGENHDLPWEFTMDLYPTIIFFPAARYYFSKNSNVIFLIVMII
jgi:hypothetical protein